MQEAYFMLVPNEAVYNIYLNDKGDKKKVTFNIAQHAVSTASKVVDMSSPI